MERREEYCRNGGKGGPPPLLKKGGAELSVVGKCILTCAANVPIFAKRRRREGVATAVGLQVGGGEEE